MLSNIAAGTNNQIDQLFSAEPDYGLIRKIVYIAGNTDWVVRKEAIYTVCNIITKGTEEQAKIIAEEMKFFEVFAPLLYCDDVQALLVILEALDKLLLISFHNGLKYEIMLEEAQGVDSLEQLQNHPNSQVYDTAYTIVCKYFNGDEEEIEDQNIAPAIFDGEFTFGLQPTTKHSVSSPPTTTQTLNFRLAGSSAYNMM